MVSPVKKNVEVLRLTVRENGKFGSCPQENLLGVDGVMILFLVVLLVM